MRVWIAESKFGHSGIGVDSSKVDLRPARACRARKSFQSDIDASEIGIGLAKGGSLSVGHTA